MGLAKGTSNTVPPEMKATEISNELNPEASSSWGLGNLWNKAKAKVGSAVETVKGVFSGSGNDLTSETSPAVSNSPSQQRIYVEQTFRSREVLQEEAIEAAKNIIKNNPGDVDYLNNKIEKAEKKYQELKKISRDLEKGSDPETGVKNYVDSEGGYLPSLVGQAVQSK